MPVATVHGLKVDYLVKGDGIPLIMLAPGDFDSSIDRWAKRGVWETLRPLEPRLGRGRREVARSSKMVPQVAQDA